MKKSEHIFYKNVMHFQIKSTEGANSLIIPKKYAHLIKKNLILLKFFIVLFSFGIIKFKKT